MVDMSITLKQALLALLVASVATDAAADPALDGYADRVASWGAAEAVVDADLADVCGPGFLLWHRDLITDICAPLCTSDAECLDGLERCAVLPVPGTILDERAFVDDDPALVDRIAPADEEDVDSAVYDLVGVCDPFFDIEGTASADLVEVIELEADGEVSLE